MNRSLAAVVAVLATVGCTPSPADDSVGQTHAGLDVTALDVNVSATPIDDPVFDCLNAPKDGDDAILSTLTGMTEDQVNSLGVFQFVGHLSPQVWSAPAAYPGSPTYLVFKLGVPEHHPFSIDVHSDCGDSIAWLLDYDFRVVASNDDASAMTLDAHLSLPAQTFYDVCPNNPNGFQLRNLAETYYLVVRDAGQVPHDFQAYVGGLTGCGAGRHCGVGRYNNCINDPSDTCFDSGPTSLCPGVCGSNCGQPGNPGDSEYVCTVHSYPLEISCQ
jgi:hypothetical protein